MPRDQGDPGHPYDDFLTPDEEAARRRPVLWHWQALLGVGTAPASAVLIALGLPHDAIPNLGAPWESMRIWAMGLGAVLLCGLPVVAVHLDWKEYHRPFVIGFWLVLFGTASFLLL